MSNSQPSFEIKVYGVLHDRPLDPNKPFDKKSMVEYTFRLVKTHILCSVNYKTISLTIYCGTFDTLENAYQEINRSMKLSMKGKYLSKLCYCGDILFFPSIFCDSCNMIVDQFKWTPHYVTETMKQSYGV